jgi:hypothetical protein
MTFQTFSGRGWKTWSIASNPYSLAQNDIQSLAEIYAKIVKKNTIEPL